MRAGQSVHGAARNIVERLEQRWLFSGDFDWQTTSNIPLPTRNIGEASVMLPAGDPNAGKIVLTGYSYGGDTTSGFLIRYNTDGTVDTTFGGDGTGIVRIPASLGPSQSFALETQSVNGSTELLVGIACKPSLNQYDQVGLLRFFSDGSLDTDFGNSGLALPGLDAAPDSGGGSPSRTALAVDSQGRIIVTGERNSHTAVARFNPDGQSLDPGFGLYGVATVSFIGNVTGVAVDGSDRVVVGGYGFSNSSGYNVFEAARLTATDGTLDPSFNGTGEAAADFGGNSLANALVIDADGNVVLGGAANTGNQFGFALARFNDGGLDPGFNGGGKVITDFPDGPAFVRGMALNGTDIVAVGTGPGHSGTVVEYQSDGLPDPAFNSTGVYGDGQPGFTSPDDQLLQAGIADNGDIVATGYIWPGGDESLPSDVTVQEFTNSGIARIVDTPLTGPSKDVGNQMTVDPVNGNITVYGTAKGVFVNSYFEAHYNPDGSPDNSFGTGGFAPIAALPNVSPNSDVSACVTRFATDFGGLAQASPGATLETTDPNGNPMIVVGGTFNSDPAHNADGDSFALARYIQDGLGNWILDPAFNPGGIDSDGGSIASKWPGVSVPGTVITHFGGQGLLHALAFDGGIVAVGREGGAGVVARYTSDGGLDPTFNHDGEFRYSQPGHNYDFYAAHASDDGKLLLAGSDLDFSTDIQSVLLAQFAPTIAPFPVDPGAIGGQLQSITTYLANRPDGGTAYLATTSGDQMAALLGAASQLQQPANAPAVTVDLNAENSVVQDQTVNDPSTGVALVIDNGNFVGGSPALIVNSGNVVVTHSTFSNSTNAPTILITGGSLKLRGDTVNESTAYSQAAIEIDGGVVDLGSPSDPGNNILNVNGAGILIRSGPTGPVIVPDTTAGNSFELNGQRATPDCSLQGMVWVDFNDDASVDFGEQGIAGVPITIAGTDLLGHQIQVSLATDADGLYSLLSLWPGTYSISEGPAPSSYILGKDGIGTLGGSNPTHNLFSNIPVAADQNGFAYNFGHQPAPGAAVAKGQAAGIGFWANKNGQALIAGFSQIGAWLAATMPNTFGVGAGANDLTGFSPSQVAAAYLNRFVLKDKLDAQVMATALNAFATDRSLGGLAAAHYGFTVGTYGLGDSTWNVGSDGAAFNVSNNTTLTVMQILQDWDQQANKTSTSLRKLAIDVFGGINGKGGL